MNNKNEQVESMKQFILEVMDDWQEMGSLDGFDLHDIAVKNKILIPHTVYAPCVDDGCNCSECYDAEEFKLGATCYRFPDWLIRAAEHSNGADTGDTQAACEHHWVASANPGILCKCDKCGSETPLS